jgi:STE24 endopeptidase
LNFSYGWILVSFFWIIITIVLAKILPTLIIPLFFKYKKITDQNIYQMIMDLAQKMRIKILDIFEIDLSKMTLKANAGLVGLGKNKRVILADTLKDRYSPDEIKVILAHEFAHQKFSHLLKILFLEAIFITFNFYLIFKTVDFFLKKFNLKDIKDLSCLPLIFIYLIILEAIENPIKNFISRNFERNADRLAIKTTGLKDAFISLMEKLAQQNLSDTSPHPLIKIFFFNHPPIEERINLAKSLRDQG